MRVFVVLALAGCGADVVGGLTDPDPGADPIDLRRPFPPPPASGLRLVTPEYTIPAESEVALCWFSTYVGPTSGIAAQASYQSPYGHHVVLNATNAGAYDHPDGEVLDCTLPDALPMTELAPLLIARGSTSGSELGPESEIALPDGMAVELRQGQRLVVQSHYVNPTSDPILVQDAIDLELVVADEVETWAAPFVHVDVGLAIAPGRQEITFDCAWTGSYDLLFLAGHMHEHGAAFETRLARAAGGARTLYSVDDWDPVYRDAPPVNEYAPGELSVEAGDVFTTRCAWDNDTDHVLGFPEEMCVTFGMVYPSTEPVVCEGFSR
jgi:hypothetical protein